MTRTELMEQLLLERQTPDRDRGRPLTSPPSITQAHINNDMQDLIMTLAEALGWTPDTIAEAHHQETTP
jgi:hypothetical protein